MLSRAELDVTIDATFRDHDCIILENDYKADHCDNCKRKRATLANGALGPGKFFEDDETFSTHRLEKNGIVISKQLTIDI